MFGDYSTFPGTCNTDLVKCCYHSPASVPPADPGVPAPSTVPDGDAVPAAAPVHAVVPGPVPVAQPAAVPALIVQPSLQAGSV